MRPPEDSRARGKRRNSSLTGHMSGPGRATVAGGSQGDGGRSRLIGWEAGAEGPPVGRSLVQRIARGDDHLRALVREGDPRLQLAAQVKESHAAFRSLVMVGRPRHI